MKKIVFFNLFHNGDLHISRGIIRLIIQKVKQLDPNVSFAYSHSNDPCLLSDIPNLSFERVGGIDQFANLQVAGNCTYINTWYAQQHHKFMNIYGMTIDCLYSALDDTCKRMWNFSLADLTSDPTLFYPTIDYSKFYIQEAQKWLSSHPQKKIFVSNGNAMSGQATNFPMAPIISNIASRHPDIIFILSNQEPHNRLPNVIYSSDIIKKPSGSDLNENSFLTTHCDAIIGRASGVFSYAWTQENMFKRNFKFICLCQPGVVVYPPHQFWTHSLFSNKVNYSAKYVVSDTTDSNTVTSIIESNL
jgi:hypothetical protein